MKLLLALALFVASPTAGFATSPPPVTTLGDCATCDKHIYFGETCVTCILAERRAERSHPCGDCAAPILFGERCATCVLGRTRAQLAHPCVDCEQTILVGTRCASCSTAHFKLGLRGALERATAAGSLLGADARARLAALFPKDAAEQLEQTKAVATAESSWLTRAEVWSTSTGTAIAAGVEDLELRRRAGVAVGAALEVASAIEATKRHLAEAGIERALALPVQSELGKTSLGDLARAKLIAAAPALAGTALLEDPAAVLAALVVADPLAFVMELELVPGEDGPKTVLAALAEKSATDPTAAFACLTILEATQRLQRGEDITRSLRDISRGLEALAPAND